MLASKKRSFNDSTTNNTQEPASKKRKLTEPSTDHDDKTDDLNAFLDDDDDTEEVTHNEIESTQNDASSKQENNDDPTLDDLPLPSDEWESLDLHKNTLLALYNQGFDKMMQIQQLAIPHLLCGDNLVGSARTGSGKTLAFLVPTIEIILDNEWNYREQGVAALIIAPTRELAMQIRNVAKTLCEYHNLLSIGLLIGGNPRHCDKLHITKGMTICIATPGRLLDHLQRTQEFVCSNVKILVLDEADRILDEGYEKEMKQILSFLPKEGRQTMLFSATQTKKTKDLIRLSFDRKPVFVDDGSCIDYSGMLRKKTAVPTRECLEQGYIVVDTHRKLLLLFSFIKKHCASKKIMVFFSTVAVTRYFVSLLNYVDIGVHGLFGAMSQSERSKTFNAFIESSNGVLLATNVAARGLDIPNIDWIIQYDPPNDIKNYIHRVGRTNRGVNEQNGKALLFLIPNELRYLHVLNKYNIGVKEYQCPPKKKIANIQSQLEKITSTVYHLHVDAHKAYQAYIREYGLRNSNIFDVLSLNICDVAKSFGLSAPPKMSIQVRKNKKYKTVTMRLQTNKWANKQDKYDLVVQ
eukprot:273538_1